jgi:hypothetical protein
MKATVELARSLAKVSLNRATAAVSYARSIAAISFDRAKIGVVFDRAVIAAVEIGRFIDQLRKIFSDTAQASDSGFGLMTDYAETPFEYFAEDYIGDKVTF